MKKSNKFATPEFTQYSQEIFPLCQSTQSNIQDRVLSVRKKSKILNRNNRIFKKK